MWSFKLSFPRKRESIDPPARKPGMDFRFRGNDKCASANEKAFKAHLLGGPKVEDFAIVREKDFGRALDI
jgi:hypothetical protein